MGALLVVRLLAVSSLLFGSASASDLSEGAQRFAVRQSVAVQVKNPNPMAASRWTTVRTTGWGFVDWERDGDGVSYTETTCDIATSRVFGTSTHYSPAFIGSLGQRVRRGVVQGDGLVVGPYVQVVGARLDAPGDPLPTSPEQAADTDGDGLPGVTVAVSQAVMGEGEVYVAQRSTNTLTLSPVGDGWRGTIDSQVEEVVLDATTWWLKADRASRPHPDPSESTVELVPIDGDAGCAEVLARRDRLFSALAAR